MRAGCRQNVAGSGDRREVQAALRWGVRAVEVIALVGPAGCGKSHHAPRVAYEQGCDLIVDDGLLIREGRILCGKSAKHEQTRIGAVKCAILSDPEHRQAMQRAIAEAGARRILVLGTSPAMAERIADALNLPPPQTVLRIEDVATPAQIRTAQRRRQEGSHVIPALTPEVRRTFSGYLVDPLRFFLRRKRGKPVAFESARVRPVYSSLGKLTIADTVIAAIVAHVAKHVPGIHRVERTVVEMGESGIRLEIAVAVVYGVPIREALTNLQQRVRTSVEETTALCVRSLHVAARTVRRR